MNRLRQMAIILLLMMAALPMAAQRSGDEHLSIRTNLLRWATLTPDLGVEWRLSRDVGIAVNGSWTTWRWYQKRRRYALREIAPEVRYYLGSKKRGYVGAMYKAGAFNYKLSATGKQGNINGGGITAGYKLPICSCEKRPLMLDFSVGLGYLHASFDEYTVEHGERVKCGEGKKKWWGLTNAAVTMVWTIF